PHCRRPRRKLARAIGETYRHGGAGYCRQCRATDFRSEAICRLRGFPSPYDSDRSAIGRTRQSKLAACAVKSFDERAHFFFKKGGKELAARVFKRWRKAVVWVWQYSSARSEPGFLDSRVEPPLSIPTKSVGGIFSLATNSSAILSSWRASNTAPPSVK